MAKIGIKLADGAFFPIMDEEFSASETLELTTVRDDQRSVQINLFKKEDDISEPSYIGSLIVEDIHEKSAGEPTIELRLSLDDNKNLSAEAVDKDSGARQALRVSLETFSDQSFDDLDFDLNAETAEIDLTASSFDSERSDDQQSFSAASFYTDEEDTEEPVKKHGLPVWLLVFLILLGVGALILGILLLTKKSVTEDDSAESTAKNVVIVPSSTAVQTPAEPEAPQPAPALPPDTSVTEPPTPADNAMADTEADSMQSESDTAQSAMESSSTKDSSLPAPMGQAIRYKLRWGDTLWDISETYYRNPWLYTKIAEHNKFKNPDLVISGTYIEIPPQ